MLKKLQKKLFINKKERQSLFQSANSTDLIIFDDFFPGTISTWRNLEYSTYFDQYNTKVVTTLTHYQNGKINSDRNYIKDLEILQNVYPSIKDEKVLPFKGPINISAKCHYFVFFSNTNYFFNKLERFQIPFAFTLYPGGGFWLYNHEILSQLKKICRSKHFKAVIVTQEVTKNYLIDNNLCDPHKIHFIFGCPLVVDNDSIRESNSYFPYARKTLNVCFVSAKYTDNGLDKGFDVFAKVAKKFSSSYDFVKFYSVGGFDKKDEKNITNECNISCEGYQSREWLKKFFDQMDVIISPNRAFSLKNGAFDGFPTGSVAEASLRGVCVLASDPLDNRFSSGFIPEKNFFLISDRVSDTINTLEHLIMYPDKIHEVGINGQSHSKHVYSFDKQLSPRLDIIKNVIDDSCN